MFRGLGFGLTTSWFGELEVFGIGGLRVDGGGS